jgi:nitrogen fixation protein NifQ
MAELLGRPAAALAQADPLRAVLASLLTGRCLGQGVLPATLGLPTLAWQALCADYFSGPALPLRDGPGQDLAERDDLLALLLRYRAGLSASEVWLAHIVAHACCGRQHLWQDLGLANRSELSTLMTVAFPRLAALNSNDMKWKKFIYHHYCSSEGIYVCPSPSCGQCADYKHCYSPED